MSVHRLLCSPAFVPAHPMTQSRQRARPTIGKPDVGRRTQVGAQVFAGLPTPLQACQAAGPTLWRSGGAQLARVLGQDTLAGQHPFLSASGGLLGLVAAGALTRDIYLKLPPQQQADVRAALRQLARGIQSAGPYVTSLILGAAAGTLAQEGAVRWLERRHASAALMLVAALPLGLGSLESIGKKLDIPLLRAAWSGPASFCEQHQRDVSGALVSAAGGASTTFALRFLAANNPWGWMLLAGSAPATLGGLELIGREHDIPGLRDCLSHPLHWSISQVRLVLSQDAAMQMTGAALAIAGSWGVLAGLRHLGLPASGLHDALGAAQVTAGTLAAGMGSGMLAERRQWIPSAQHVFERCSDAMASAIFSAWGAALGKFATYSMLAFGPTYTNTAAAALALGMVNTGAIAAFRQTQQVQGADKSVRSAVEPHMEARIRDALDRAWALSGSMGSGVWACLVAGGLLRAKSETPWLSAINAVPQLGAAVALGAVSAGMMGYGLNHAGMKKISNDVADSVKEGINNALHVAKHYPLPTLATLGALLALAKQSL